MTTFTDNELIKEIKERIGSLDVRDNIERRAYEIALALLEAEPVAYQYRQWDAEYDEWGEWEGCGECAFERFVEEEKCQGAGVQTRKLYAAPPVQAQGIEIAINELVALSPRLDKQAVETLSMAVAHLRKLVKD
ncbi:putative phage protein [Escherichia coli]|uniref:hypothetical protein n=1 Tax=Escherichia coli TaxID=562 RepID=UPI0010CB6517|nr:putative phage protein [Escherichia coli]